MGSLSRDEIALGFEALRRSLGPDKGRLFLDYVASGALDPSLLTKAQAWARRNPELVAAGASLVGGFLASFLAASVPKPRSANKEALRMLQAVLSQAVVPSSTSSAVSEPAPEPDVIDVEGVSSSHPKT